MLDLLIGLLTLLVPSRSGSASWTPRWSTTVVYLATAAAAPVVLTLVGLDELGILPFPFGFGTSVIGQLFGLAEIVILACVGLWILVGWPFYLVTIVRFRRELRMMVPSLVFIAAEVPLVLIVLEHTSMVIETAAVVLFAAYAVLAGWVGVGEFRRRQHLEWS